MAARKSTSSEAIITTRRTSRKNRGKTRLFLRPGENPGEGIRTLAILQIKAAISELGEKNVSAESIHKARTSVKKLRSIIQLISPSLKKGPRETLEGLLQESSLRTSLLRDSEVQVETFDHLLGNMTTPSEQLSPLRRGLTDVAKQHRVNGLRQIPRVIGFLRKAHREVSKWKLGDLEGKDLRRRIRRTYRRGRSTLDLAIAAGDTETFHEWRKLVKQLWYQLRITNRFWTDRAEPLIAEIGAIGELAGEERDLTILSGTVRLGAKSEASLQLLDLIETQRSQLRAKAVSAGETFYEKKPKAFVEGLDL